MATLNHPDKMQLDAFADPNLELLNPNGVYNRFTNVLKTPLLGCKGIMLLSANFVNSTLQLNDQSQLMFFYYSQATTQAGIATLANLHCIRLLPSSYVPYAGFTAYTQNKYFNSGTELAAALNLAAGTGGDSATYNPTWIAGEVTFAYDTAARKFTIAGNGTKYIAPAAADDPNVLDLLRGTTNPNNRIRMNGATNVAQTWASSTAQPYVEGISMNARIGFAMPYAATGLWWSSSSQRGVATSTGIPSGNTAFYADANPILLGTQNVDVYLSVSTGGGVDAYGKKNLIASVPIDVPPLNINPYTTNSVQTPSLSTPNEIYEITVELLDENGQPFYQPPNFNTQIALGLFY